ncbi:MAG TPA: Ig-like domain-containing protein [Chitinophagales bacterium]|nr:Ig-like domain-containing protein [Chitinophagales bacterium]
MKSWFYIFIALFLFVGCATPSAPQGGIQDTQAPIIKNYQPEFLVKNFKAKDILIIFDEWIQVSNIKQNVIISPPIIPEPIITAKKTELKIHFKAPLDSNTTYSIFFGGAVKDNNEGNIIDNMSYVFSTGDYIDSLSINGRVYSMDGQAIPENTFIELYTASDDSIITKERPKYIYKVAKDGSFKLEYLPQDTFQIFVLNDLNTNYLYDLPTEWIGKYKSTIFLDSIVENLQIPISLPEVEKFKVMSFNSTLLDHKVTIELNKELNPQKDTISLTNLRTSKILPFDQNYTSKKFTFLTLIDSISATCVLSINSKVIDTLKLKQPSKQLENSLFLPKGQVNRKDSILRAFENRDFEFISTLPIYNIDTSRILLISTNDSLLVSQVEYDSLNFNFLLNFSLQENYNGHLVFLDSAVQFSSGQFSKNISYPIQYSPKEEWGQLQLNIQLPSLDTSYIVRVFHSNNRLEFETTILGDSVFQYIIPYALTGEYFVEVIEDLNNSATWNGSSFWKSLPPERVFKSEMYSIKPNWENEYKIEVNFDKKQLPTQMIHLLDLLSVTAKPSTSKTNNTITTPSVSPLSSPRMKRDVE